MSHAVEDLITIREGDTEAIVAPMIGANCLAFRVGGRDVIEPPRSPAALLTRPAYAGCPVLFPFPGQLAEGRYRLDGRAYTLPINVPERRAHAHGFTARRPWQLQQHDAAACTCTFHHTMLAPEEEAGYPWPFSLTLRWSVQPGLLRADVRVEDTGSTDLPFGFGLHPYLTVPDDAVVHLPAAEAWPHVAGVPSGPPEPTAQSWPWASMEAGASLLCTGMPAGIVEATVGATTLRFPGDRFGEVVLYRPLDRPSVCIEPWTSVSGAARLIEPGQPHGLLRLAPGATWSAWVEIGDRAGM